MSEHLPAPVSADYIITDNITHDIKKYGLTAPVLDLIQDIYYDVRKGKKSTIKRLERLCKKYPKVP